MFDKNTKHNKVSAQNSSVIIGDNGNIKNTHNETKNGVTKILALITALIVLITAIVELLSK